MEYPFTISGGFDVADNLNPLYSADGQVIGFALPDGRIARLALALEVENTEHPYGPQTFDYLTATDEMEALGFSGMDYDRTEFEADLSYLVRPGSPPMKLAGIVYDLDGPLFREQREVVLGVVVCP